MTAEVKVAAAETMAVIQLDTMYKNRELERKYSSLFYRTFGVPLHCYFSYITGFNITVFDSEIVKTPDNKSMREAVRERYGLRGESLILTLLCLRKGALR